MNNRYTMNFVINNKLYNTNNIYIMDPVSNNVIENGSFCRIIYSNSHMTLNSIIFKIPLEEIRLTRSFNKYKLSYSTDHNHPVFMFIERIEKELLDKYALSKNAVCSIANSIKNDTFKLYSEKEIEEFRDKITIYLKISGFWVNDADYGLTYKFLY